MNFYSEEDIFCLSFSALTILGSVQALRGKEYLSSCSMKVFCGGVLGEMALFLRNSEESLACCKSARIFLCPDFVLKTLKSKVSGILRDRSHTCKMWRKHYALLRP